MANDLRRYGVTPFGRFAIANACSTVGDAFLTVTLAGTVFFAAVSPDAARSKVIPFLLFTMAPFAIVAPVIGPALDRSRGGRRALMIGGYFVRAVLLLLLVAYYDTIFLYPLAFGCLVVSKGHSVAKSALVPSLVSGEMSLVDANSRLAIITGLAGVAGAIPAGLLYGLSRVLFDSAVLVLIVGAAVYVVGGVLALRIPKAEHVAGPTTPLEREELAAPGVLFAVTAMAMMRFAVGFLTWFAGFSLKQQDAPLWLYGVMLAFSAAGGLLGNVVASVVRRAAREEVILVGSLVVPSFVALAAARYTGNVWIVATAFTVAVGGSTARVAFESLVQRDAPDAARGRNFARFETRFQVVWVVGSLIPVLLFPRLSVRAGLFILALVLAGSGLSYLGTLYRKPTERPVRFSERVKRFRSGRAAAPPVEVPPPPDE